MLKDLIDRSDYDLLKWLYLIEVIMIDWSDYDWLLCIMIYANWQGF